MKFVALGLVIASTAFAPQVIGQENKPTEQKEPLHLSGGTERANINFAAESIERQDSPTPSASPYASVVRLKGNVVIRTCCVQKGIGQGKRQKNQPKQLVIMHADEADYHQDTGEIEARGNVRVNFQNYPK
jgi:lipopolysaccharide assembly outer membrane protein LptD (OstA)